MIQHFLDRQFLFFLLTGGTAAVVNFSSRIFYNYWLTFSWSIILAYITGMITAFILAKLFVFRESTQAIYHSIIFFVLINLLAVAQTWGISIWFAFYALPMLGVKLFIREISHAIGVVVPVFTSYIGHKFLSFR